MCRDPRSRSVAGSAQGRHHGHYHRIVNLTQRTAIEPTDVGVLDKLLEFGHSSGSVMAALWLLLGREAWCGDRVAILGYEGRPGDLAPEVVAETGLDGSAYYNRTLGSAAQLARDLLVERGICTFTTKTSHGVELWRATASTEITPAGVDFVAANLDRGEVLDPAQFGDNRDLNLAAAGGGQGGVTTALAIMLAASNRGGSRGGGDLRSRHRSSGPGPAIAWASCHSSWPGTSRTCPNRSGRCSRRPARRSSRCRAAL
jgi:hypothetical protein